MVGREGEKKTEKTAREGVLDFLGKKKDEKGLPCKKKKNVICGKRKKNTKRN